MAVGIDLVGARLADVPYEGDAVVDDAHVGPEGPETGAVDDGSVPDHQVIGHVAPVLARVMRLY